MFLFFLFSGGLNFVFLLFFLFFGFFIMGFLGDVFFLVFLVFFFFCFVIFISGRIFNFLFDEFCFVVGVVELYLRLCIFLIILVKFFLSVFIWVNISLFMWLWLLVLMLLLIWSLLFFIMVIVIWVWKLLVMFVFGLLLGNGRFVLFDKMFILIDESLCMFLGWVWLLILSRVWLIFVVVFVSFWGGRMGWGFVLVRYIVWCGDVWCGDDCCGEFCFVGVGGVLFGLVWGVVWFFWLFFGGDEELFCFFSVIFGL